MSEMRPGAPENASEQNLIRIDKLRALERAGQSPYEITRFDQTHHAGDILEKYDALEGEQVSIAGRMISRRVMGKASFAHIQDVSGRMQVYVRRDDVGEDAYAAFKDTDIGDVLGVKGHVFRTRAGEISVHAAGVVLLTKCLHPLPEKFHGLKDTDLRYRQRYLDLIVNPEVKETFVKRSGIIRAVRDYLDARGYLEVDTPVLGTLEIGAAARPFVTHHNALDIDMFVRIETELHLKRLVVGGAWSGSTRWAASSATRAWIPATTRNLLSWRCTRPIRITWDVMDLIENLFQYVTTQVQAPRPSPTRGRRSSWAAAGPA